MYMVTSILPHLSMTGYIMYENVSARSHDSGSNWQNQQHGPAYPGMELDHKERVGNNREINYYYVPKIYGILFMDGIYEDGAHKVLKNNSTNTLDSRQDENGIAYGSDVSTFNTYDPSAKIPDGADYVFLGWYSDDQCTKPYTFDKMPEGGITVYARWMLKEYKVTLHPQENGDESFKYINGNPAGHYGTNGDVIWVDNGEKIGNVGGTRDLYDLTGWFTNEGLTKVWDFDAFTMNDTIVSKYGELYALDGTDSRYDPAYPGTVGEVNLYASWRRILDGADGINVVYTAMGKDGDGNEVIGTNAPTDPNQYSDQAQAIARPAATAPESEDKLAFQYWVVQKWNGTAYEDTMQNVFPGDRFKVNFDDAQMSDVQYEEDGTTIKSATYTVQLRAQYGSAEDATPTHIYWYNNYTNSESGILRKDDDLAINQTVTILAAPTRAGYDFLGWARKPETNADKTTNYYVYEGLTATDLLLTYDSANSKYTYTTTGDVVKTATGVFADENIPYDGMYAVWEAKEVGYTVEFYYMNDDGTYPTTATSSDTTRKAKTDTEVSVTEADKTPSDATKYALDTTKSVGWTGTVAGDGSLTLKVYFKLNQVTVTVHHYLKGTTTEVTDDVTATVEIGESYTAQPVTKYEEKDLTVDSYNPSQTVTVTTDGTEITIYYTLPLTITAEPGSKKYDGTPLNGEFTLDGQLSADEAAIKTALGEVPSITDVSKIDYLTTEDQGKITGIPSYYVVTYVPGTLEVTKRTVTLTSATAKKVYDGTALTKNADTDITVGGDGFVGEEGATYSITGTQTLVGTPSPTR